MQTKITCTVVLLAGALVSTLTLAAQQVHAERMHIQSYDVAVLGSFERAQVAQPNGNRFWLKGGSVDGSVTLYKGIGLAANLTGEHASNIQNNVSLGTFAYMAGPRFTLNATPRMRGTMKPHPVQVFGEALFGGVHAFDSVFPGTSGVQASANAFSMQLGGGLDVPLQNGFGLRALEMDFVHTALPNNGSNSQNDLRIAFGVSFRR